MMGLMLIVQDIEQPTCDLFCMSYKAKAVRGRSYIYNNGFEGFGFIKNTKYHERLSFLRMHITRHIRYQEWAVILVIAYTRVATTGVTKAVCYQHGMVTEIH